MTRWYLEGFFQSDNVKSKHPLIELPQIIGRDETHSCVIRAASVSRNHAKIEERGGQIWITDLSSRNGTYVNRTLISEPMAIRHGDVLHFGTAETRLIDTTHVPASNNTQQIDTFEETQFFAPAKLSEQFPSGINELEQLISTSALEMVFQPIIRAASMSFCGYEVLGRGASPDLPKSPLDLFRIAESFNLEVRLSEVMRDKGVEQGVKCGLKGALLINTHPSELLDVDKLLASLTSLRQRFQKTPLTLEIHEQSVTDNSDLLRSLKKQLDTLSIKLAFDDFGVGQSRLMEMVEAKPNLIKFDKVLISGIDQDESRQNLLRHLKELASELSIQTLAECVETEGEYRVCNAMGFDYYQGYYFAKPQPGERFSQ